MVSCPMRAAVASLPSPARRRSRGFTLVEVVVALVILEVGLMGSAGLLLLASRTLTRSETLEWATAHVSRVADSLLYAAGGPGSGSEPVAGGDVSWSVAPDGSLRVAYRSAVDGREWVVIEGLVEARSPGDGVSAP
ncbi:MAG: type II secretion system GspH family protein [Gemmatimonadota bacterium]|nr:type II secretion system GspH family protein [Gemmatimonadota bacterium]